MDFSEPRLLQCAPSLHTVDGSYCKMTTSPKRASQRPPNFAAAFLQRFLSVLVAIKNLELSANGPAEVQCELFGPISGLNFER